MALTHPGRHYNDPKFTFICQKCVQTGFKMLPKHSQSDRRTPPRTLLAPSLHPPCTLFAPSLHPLATCKLVPGPSLPPFPRQKPPQRVRYEAPSNPHIPLLCDRNAYLRYIIDSPPSTQSKPSVTRKLFQSTPKLMQDLYKIVRNPLTN